MIRQFFSSFLFVLILFCSCNSKTTDKWEIAKNDSINKYLEIAGNDTIDLKIRNSYNDKAFSLLDLKKNDTLTRYYLSLISYNYMRTKKEGAFINTIKIYYKKSNYSNDSINLARYYRIKAGYFNSNKKYDSAFSNILKSEKCYKLLKDRKNLALIHMYKNYLQYKVDDFLGAELSASLSYNYYKKTNNYIRITDCLISLGNIYNNLKEFDKSIFFHKKAYNIIISNKVPQKKGTSNSAMCLNNIGNAFRQKRQYRIAIKYFDLALKEKKLILIDPESYALLLNNMGYCQMQLNDFSNLPNFFERSAKIFDSLCIRNECSVSNIYLSNFYLKVNDIDNVKEYVNKSLKIAELSDSPYYYLNALKNASLMDSNSNSKYIEDYHIKNDSLQLAERKTRNQYYKIQLETNEIKEEKETAIKQKWGVVWVSILIILFITLLLIITKQRQKQKELQFHQSQQKSNEEIYDLMLTQKSKEELIRSTEKTRIAMELHDGVMNRLTSTRLNLNTLNFKKDAATIAKCLTYIEGIYDIEQEIRNIAHNLNTDVFKENSSFIALLENFIMGYKSSTGLKCVFEYDDAIDWNLVSSGIKMNLYRIIQEACHNVDKHADARNIRIDLILCDSNICMSISDDGIGFNVKTNNDGIGLTNIRKRVESLSGELNIKSKKRNTSINITIPFTARS